MSIFTRIKRKISLFLVFTFTICLILLPNLNWVNAQKVSKPKPQDWHISGIMAALDDGDPKVQRYALNLLGRYEAQDLKAELKKPEDVAQKTAKILKDKNVDPRVRGSAVLALGKLGDAAKPYLEDIADILKDKTVDSSVRGSAASALGNLGDAAKPYLEDIADILKDKTVDSSVRGSAASALGNLGDAAKPYLEDIADILKDKTVDSSVRGSAASALGNLGDAAKPYVKDIADILKDQKIDSEVRAGAAYVLGNLGDAAKPYIKDIADILKDQNIDPEVRAGAAYVLGNSGDTAKPYFKDILEFIKDKTINPRVRADTAYVLWDLGDTAKPYVKDVVDIFKDKSVDQYVRSIAAQALGKLGNVARPYVKDILELLKDKSLDINIQQYGNSTTTNNPRVNAAKALGNLGSAAKPYIKDILDFLKDQTIDKDIRGGVARALGNLGDAAKPYLKDIADIPKDKNVDSYVRISTAYALVNLGDTAKPYVKDIADILKDKNVSPSVRGSAAEALGNLENAAKPYIKDIADILKDKTVAQSTLSSAAKTLGKLGYAAKPYVKDILEFLKDKTVDQSTRSSAAEALSNIKQLELKELPLVLYSAYYDRNSNIPKWRWLTYFLSGGSDEAKKLLEWVAYPKTTPEKLTRSEGIQTLEQFLKIWEVATSEDLPELRDDLAKQIAVVAAYKKVRWQPQDITLLGQHYKNLKKINSTHAETIQSVIIKLEGWRWFFNFRNIILTHAAFWLALIFAYPKSPQIQAIFFWNPWIRRIAGMGYVGFLLTWVPFLRRKLLEPFQRSLLADAQLDNFTEATYFPESSIKPPASEKVVPITKALPTIKGQIVLEGDSGLGKSMFLCHLLKNTSNIAVYLPAYKCEKGVIEAIQEKLRGQAQDINFLKSLIYSGAIDIYIDGLNEVTADTRSQIKQFVESYFHCNMIMTTQPLQWEPPSTAKIFILKPLTKQQISQFLTSRYLRLPADAKIKEDSYKQACKNYLIKILDPQQPATELEANYRVLSNPMDLTLISQMLSQGEHPDLFRLQEQQYNLMAWEYKRNGNMIFP